MVFIEKLKIHNFKCYKEFEITFNNNVNIIVGNNEEGKSTILEAAHLVVSGIINGRYLYNDLSESLFNREIVDNYLNSLGSDNKQEPPYILIEAFLGGEGNEILQGDDNSNKIDSIGISCKISFDDHYQDEYQELINQGNIKTLPIEYYKIERVSFARNSITNKSIPLKSVVIDSSNKNPNGSDIYISRIIKENLDEKELTALSQSYRKLKENFSCDASINAINQKISNGAKITDKAVSISVDMSIKNSWDTVLMTYIDKIPFHQIGKGEQCIIKTNLALSHHKAQESNLVLIEEPENHLSHTSLNCLLQAIDEQCADKQLIITTHSNFVANKLGLNNLILLASKNILRLDDLQPDDAKYFKIIPGYDTLRLILSKGAILVEGPSDELVVQRAYKDIYGKLPIADGIDVISVRGLSFKRFLKIAKKLTKRTVVITDNDGDYETKITQKYADYTSCDCIKICADDRNKFNTLEPQFANANNENLQRLKGVLQIDTDTSIQNEEAISDYMKKHKTDWALKVFESSVTLEYPQYIKDAVEWISEKIN